LSLVNHGDKIDGIQNPENGNARDSFILAQGSNEMTNDK
jgi:hypothetical protein